MDNLITISLTAGGIIAGGALGFFARQFYSQKSLEKIEAKQKEIILNAKDEALKIKEKLEAVGAVVEIK